MADSLLNDTARREVALLLGNESLADAATFMDRERDSLAQRFPDSPRWHYDNVPVCGTGMHCADGHCASAQLLRWQKVLADRQAPKASRLLALRLIAHLVGDLHQPLHAADHDDRGGNKVLLQNYTPPRNLHEVLDSNLVRQVAGKRTAKQLAKLWRNHFASQLAVWRNGNPSTWLAESHALAVNHVYRPLPGFACHQHADSAAILVDETYLQQLQTLIPMQLTKAGVRLAALLNHSLS